jgi:hypothetical protein
MSVGTVLDGRFELLAVANTGGMASVYRARDRKTGGTVAVKILRITKPADVARFVREAELLATVRHDNVVGYVAHGSMAGMHYLVQDWVDGLTLSGYLRQVGTDLRDAVTIAQGVASALAATHALGVVHRDIKPSNILLAGASPHAVRVVDFGIARRAIEAGLLTRTGTVVGSPPYMSPEQTRGSVDIGPPSDVWQLGVVLYEMLSGRPAFAARTQAAVRAKIFLVELPPLEKYCPEVPPALAALVDSMLDKDSARRPANGADVLARLVALPPLGEGPRRGVIVPETATAVMPRRKARTKGNTDSAFVMFTPFEPPDGDSKVEGSGEDHVGKAEHERRVNELAAKNQLDVHLFEDGTALLSSRADGKEGALAAAQAALQAQEWGEGGVALFARAYTESMEEAIDRGAGLLERATVAGAIGLDEDATCEIQIDRVIADLIGPEMPVAETPDGPVLQVQARRE